MNHLPTIAAAAPACLPEAQPRQGSTPPIPALNRHGVAYRDVLERERVAHARLVRELREALRAWVAADAVPAEVKGLRRELLEQARQKTARALT